VGNILGTLFIGGWVGPRAGLDGCRNSRPTGLRSPDGRALIQSLYYPGPQYRGPNIHSYLVLNFWFWVTCLLALLRTIYVISCLSRVIR